LSPQIGFVLQRCYPSARRERTLANPMHTRMACGVQTDDTQRQFWMSIADPLQNLAQTSQLVLKEWFCNDYRNSAPAWRLGASRWLALCHIETDFTGLAREEFRMKNLTIGMLALSGLLIAGCSYQTQIDQATSQAESSAQQASTASSNAQNSANAAAQSAKTAQEAAAGAEDSVKRANDAVARLEAAFASSVTK